MKIFLFGGTTEGRVLAEKLADMDHFVAVSCATGVGVEQLKDINCVKLCGRLTEDDMADLIKNYDLVVDATHPYSTAVTKNIRHACLRAKVPLRRILRMPGQNPDCVQVRSCQEAAEFLKSTEGNILLTTGSKELSAFSILPPKRIFARVLPTHDALNACEKIALPHKNIIAMQGPFSREMNEATIRSCRIEWLVTRNSGDAGGYEEKISAAEACGIRIVLIELPENEGVSMEEFLKEVENACK